jgi:hypothetical protein
MGVDISMAGLALQLVVLFLFIVAFADYMFRYWRSGRMVAMEWRLKAFFAGLTVSIAFILARCAYRVAELREGYNGDIIKHEIPFIVLEGVVIAIAAAALFLCHPEFVFRKTQFGAADRKTSDSDSASAQPMSNIDV